MAWAWATRRSIAATEADETEQAAVLEKNLAERQIPGLDNLPDLESRHPGGSGDGAARSRGFAELQIFAVEYGRSG